MDKEGPGLGFLSIRQGEEREIGREREREKEMEREGGSWGKRESEERD